ncbi:MAG: thioredoxin, partial [Pseudomonadota bacterium]|nr:thioredoxin [Pseudomonadota bacterium]
MPEKDMVRRWGAMFTPTMMFFPEEVPEGLMANQAAVVNMPGAFGKMTTLNMLRWVVEKGYHGDEPFQKYLARMIEQERSQ